MTKFKFLDKLNLQQYQIASMEQKTKIRSIGEVLFTAGITAIAIGLIQLYLGNVETGSIIVGLAAIYFAVIDGYRIFMQRKGINIFRE